ncbi:MAG TPA: hypothetical protein VFJ71_01325 [Candidatus Limnocylindrales bacterium]|nr:hypothetical protein [Candidatus Limnocylindrales bacterium]
MRTFVIVAALLLTASVGSAGPVAAGELSGAGSGTLISTETAAVVGSISASVRGRYEAGTGFVRFRMADPAASWTGTIHYADYWFDPSGDWYVAFVEGCKDGPTCEPFVLQLVDGRVRSDGHDEVSLKWQTLADFDWDWPIWYGIGRGNLEVPFAG